MSHLKRRAEQICLNCATQLEGPFCHICGQENIEPKESVWHLFTHFFNDITHFDGKFFDTVRLLIRKPGFLPKQYMIGKRTSYLNPVRMYIFTSAFFFLIFFSIFHISDKSIDNGIMISGKTLQEMRALSPDSLAAFTAAHNNGKAVRSQDLDKYFDSIKTKEGFHFTDSKYRSKAAYDSMLKKGLRKHNWVERQLIYKEIEANEKYHDNGSQYLTALFSAFQHSFPQMLFVSLPIFAWFLQLLYRRQKAYFYVSHGIFSIHFYIFIFIDLLLIFSVNALRDWLGWRWLGFISSLLILSIFFYLYKAMRNFYQQRRAKTVVKFLLLNIFSMLLMGVLFAVFILLSFMKI